MVKFDAGLYSALRDKFVSVGLSEDLFLKKSFNLLVDKNKVVVRRPAPGVRSEVIETDTGVRTKIYVEPGVRLSDPVNICFGISEVVDLQTTDSEIIIGEGANLKFLVYSVVSHGIKTSHKAMTKIFVEKDASFEFFDIHFVGDDTFVDLSTYTQVEVAEGAYFKSVFKQTRGRAGNIHVRLVADVGDRATAAFETKLIGKEDDRIKVEDIIYLNGRLSKGISKSRIVALDSTHAEFLGETHGNAPLCRGHIDCSEVIRGKNVVVKAVPVVFVKDETAKVTHEAAIGRIDKRQLETLMSRGLSEDEAIDVIVQGMLR